MGRRGKDLFQALARRQDGAPPEPERGGELREVVNRVRDTFASWFSPGNQGKKKRGHRAAKRAVTGVGSPIPEWLPIAALALVVFGGGFAVGRWTSGSPVEGAELARSQGPMRPRELADPPRSSQDSRGDDRRGVDRATLSADDEQKALSSLFFPVMIAGRNRALASGLARHFRVHDVDTARIVQWPNDPAWRGDPHPWVVVVYVRPGDDPNRVRDAILATPSTDLDPNFRENLARVRQRPQRFP